MSAAGCACGSPPRRRLRGLSTLLPALAVAAIPKCPLCWAAYMAVLGTAGLSVPYRPWLLPVSAVLLGVSLALLWAGRRGPFLLGLAGAALLVAGRLLLDRPAAVWAGTALVAAAALWSVLGRWRSAAA